MEIYLNEEKAKKNNIDLNECYQKIDKYFKSRGVEIVSKGIYKGVRKDFDTFAIALCFGNASKQIVNQRRYRLKAKMIIEE